MQWYDSSCLLSIKRRHAQTSFNSIGRGTGLDPVFLKFRETDQNNNVGLIVHPDYFYPVVW